MNSVAGLVLIWFMVLVFVGTMVYLTGSNGWAWLLVPLLFMEAVNRVATKRNDGA